MRTKTYKTSADLIEHIDNCKDGCDKLTHTYCDKLHEISWQMPNSEFCTMPWAECAHCGGRWEETDYSETSFNSWKGQKLSCQNCGMIHEVIAAEMQLVLQIEETGEFDLEYNKESTDDDN